MREVPRNERAVVSDVLTPTGELRIKILDLSTSAELLDGRAIVKRGLSCSLPT